MSELSRNLAAVLQRHGFSIQEDVILLNTKFDFVAEDRTRLLFGFIRDNNNGWRDDFADHQASVATLVSRVALGRKWRDVYLLEITTDKLDAVDEVETAEVIGSDTSTARKLVIDASSLNPGDSDAAEALLSQVLQPSLTVPSYQDESLFTLLASRLEDEGFPPRLVQRLLRGFNEQNHSCIDVILEELP